MDKFSILISKVKKLEPVSFSQNFFQTTAINYNNSVDVFFAFSSSTNTSFFCENLNK